MRYLVFALCLLPGAVFAQTSEDAVPTDAEVELDDTCGAAGFQGLIGQTGDIARMLELDQPLRVIPPDTAVTMDFRLDRLNFILDGENRILRVECG